MGMTVNNDKTKVMIIKSNKDTYANFVYDNSNLEEFIELIFITSSTRTIALRKGLMEGGKLILVLKIIVKKKTLRCGIKGSSSLKL